MRGSRSSSPRGASRRDRTERDSPPRIRIHILSKGEVLLLLPRPSRRARRPIGKPEAERDLQGMGIRFLDLPSSQAERIAAFVGRNRRERVPDRLTELFGCAREGEGQAA